MSSYLVLGILISILIYEVTEISPGGIIVPGYLAMFLGQPGHIFGTLLVSGAVIGAVRFLSQHMIIYGRRKYALMLLTGLAFSGLLRGLLPMLNGLEGAFQVIGYVIPGIIAYEMDRQGAVKTASAMTVATLGLGFAVQLGQRAGLL